MSCVFPSTVWRTKRNENGKRPVSYRRADAYQYANEVWSDVELQIPCGKCTGCRADRTLSWSIRCYQESMLHKQNSFLTVTYNDENCPDSLVKSDLQRFVRALRDSGKKIRYYACGEYGDITHRPHYHLCVFGSDFKNGTEYSINDEMYGIPELNKIWGKGHIVCAEFTMATACYVAGYVGKKINKPDDDSFQLMSLRPGIGFPWLEKHYKDILLTNSVVIEGKEMPVPQAYLRWAEENLGDALDQVKKVRSERFKKMTPDQVWDKNRERRAKEVHYNQRIAEQKRKEKL